jgi:hypothetical protein
MNREITYMIDRPAGHGITYFQQQAEEAHKRDVEERNKRLNENLRPLIIQMVREMTNAK